MAKKIVRSEAQERAWQLFRIEGAITSMTAIAGEGAADHGKDCLLLAVKHLQDAAAFCRMELTKLGR